MFTKTIIFFSSFAKSIIKNKSLIMALSEREIKGRYKGSYLGFMWAIINPLLLLLVYTFVFSVVFKARWGGGVGEGKLDFALVMFVGIAIHGMLAESLNRSTGLILNNPNYVKKIVFPLEILPLVNAIAAFAHTLIALAALLIVYLFTKTYIHSTVIFIPFVLLPLFFYCIAFGYILSSLGVFIRDISQGIGFVSTALLFLSPVFYPVSSLPEYYQEWMNLNPLTLIIEQSRELIIMGNSPDWSAITKAYCFSLLACSLGYIWFQKTRKGFADVI
uniref:ABC transporter permease n=1 Tax=Cellvibrio fontiphilus TaxID=1815559 RepID=UPI002B4BBE66|nr:ABC transporter permease [Cellvibrio fontiphilus]